MRTLPAQSAALAAALLLVVAPLSQAQQLVLESVNDAPGGRPENYARRVLASPDGNQCIPGDQCMGCTFTPRQGSFIPIDYTYCLPSLSTTCDFYQNTYERSCKLWELIQPAACVAPGCTFVADGDYAFFEDLKPVHWLTLPTRPVRGMEDWDQLPGDPNAIWDLTWGLVSQGDYPEGYNQSEAVPPAQSAFIINPTDQRSQHQLHLHSLVMPAVLRDQLLPARDQPGVWTNISTTCNGTAVNLDVKYSDAPLPSAALPFESLVARVTGEAAPGSDAPEAAWWHFGLTMVPDVPEETPAGEAPTAEGWFLVVGDASDDTILAC